MQTPPGSLALAHPVHDADQLANFIREGRFQRSLSLLTAATSVISGLEVAYEHYRGSYSRRVMYTPVILSAVLAVAGIAGFFSRRAARSLLRLASAITLIDAAVGFYFHLRGVHRKPGGWRLPMTNMIMGPPIFAPLLFGTSAYLGLIASFLQREDDDALQHNQVNASWLERLLPSRAGRDLLSAEQDIREGRFQRQVAIVTGISALRPTTRTIKTTSDTGPSGPPSSSLPCSPPPPSLPSKSRASPPRRFPPYPSSPAPTPPSASSTTLAESFAAPVDATICSTTSCTAHPSSLPCSSAQPECSACSPASCAAKIPDGDPP
jgi:hypothetical protein